MTECALCGCTQAGKHEARLALEQDTVTHLRARVAEVERERDARRQGNANDSVTIRELRAALRAALAAGFREGVEASAKVVERYGCCDDDDCAGDTVWLSREIRALAPAPAKEET